MTVSTLRIATVALLLGLSAAQQPTSQTILGGDGHGQLVPAASQQTILGADGHGQLQVPLDDQPAPAPAILGADGHGQHVPAASQQILGADGHGQQHIDQTELITSTNLSPEIAGSGGSGGDDDAAADDDDDADGFWTITHWSNDTVCFDDGEGGDDDAGTWCMSSFYWRLYSIGSHLLAFMVFCVLIMQCCIIRKKTRANRELVNKLAVLQTINNSLDDDSAYGAFVQSSADTVALVPPSYNLNDSFQEKPSRLGGNWTSSIA